MTPTGNEFFYNIKGLIVSKRVVDNDIYDNINKYIDIAETLVKQLEINLNKERLKYFISNLEIVVNLLKSVCARRLVTDGDALLLAAKNNRIQHCKKHLPAFTTNMLTLSVEMQTAQAKAEKETELKEDLAETHEEIEMHEDMANNLSAVGTLINEGEYAEACDMLSEMDSKDEQDMYSKLIDLVMKKNYKEAGLLANSLKENHRSYVKSLGGAVNLTAKRILAVDDRPEVLDVINSALKDHFKVFGVTSGGAALKLLQVQAPDLFILDIDMPGINGFELAEVIRANPMHRKTPIIFLTGCSTRRHVIKALRAGGNDFVIKPTSHEALLAKVGKYLL